jgi:hypothetical protein
VLQKWRNYNGTDPINPIKKSAFGILDARNALGLGLGLDARNNFRFSHESIEYPPNMLQREMFHQKSPEMILIFTLQGRITQVGVLPDFDSPSFLSRIQI